VGARPDSGGRFALWTLAGEANSLRQAQPTFASKLCPNLMVGLHGCCWFSSFQEPFQNETILISGKIFFVLEIAL
jgi:hypothetical protein